MPTGVDVREWLRKPFLRLYLGAALIGIEACIRIFALLGPPLILHTIAHRRGTPLIESYRETFSLYFQQAAPRLGYTVQQFYWRFWFSLACSAIVLMLLILLLQRRPLVRKVLIILIS